MFGKLVLVFIVVPLLDLCLLLALSQYLTWPVTILCVVISGIIGAWLARRSSTAVMGKIRERLQRNEVPADLLPDGAMIFFAAGLLITPGVITDAVGLSLLIPPCRKWYKKIIMSYLKRHVKIVVPGKPFGSPVDSSVVDGEVTGSRTSTDRDESTQPDAIVLEHRPAKDPATNDALND